MASLAELRDALTALGISTSTGQLRGEERRLVLQQRLHDAQKQHGGVPDKPSSSKLPEQGKHPEQESESSFHTMSLTELRAELDARNLPTQTPGLKGEARRHALLQRLLNAGDTRGQHVREAVRDSAWEASSDGATSSRSSTSSYSAAGEFLFFDLSSGKRSEPQDTSPPTIPVLSIPTSPLKRQYDQVKAQQNKPEQTPASCQVREQLECELIDLRRQLHEQRTSRSLAIAKSLKDAGFQRDLDTLSASMQRLENERHRLLRVAFAHELVTTTATTGGIAIQLVQEDAVRLIEKQQAHLRHQIQLTKEAIAIVKQQQDVNQADHESEQELQTTIRRIQLQLQLHYPATPSSAVSSDQDSARSFNSFVSVASTVASSSPYEAPVLTRCRSMPASSFHEAWRELDDSQRQQLHIELKAAKSYRMRQGRVCVGDENPKSLTARPVPTVSNRRSILAFTRYPPTAADKLGIKALFLEQSDRSVVEIQRAYQQALALEPDHAVILANYAGFLDRKCGQIDQAELVFKQALRADPTCIPNVAAYARFLHHRRRDFTRAEELYIQVLRSSPRDAVVLGNYASLLHKLASKTTSSRASQLMQAKQFFLQATEIDASDVSNRLRLCGVYEELSEITEAQRCYEKLVEDLEQWLPQQANQDAESTPRTAERTVVWAHAYGNFANFLQRTGQLERAKAMYKAALSLQSDDKLLQRNFSVFLRDYGQRRKVSAHTRIGIQSDTIQKQKSVKH